MERLLACLRRFRISLISFMALRVRNALVLGLLVLGMMAQAKDGGDVSNLYSKSDYDCAKSHGWDFVVARSYCSFGGVDPNAKANMDAAKAAGLKRDVYHFPCHGKVDAKTQVHDDVAHVGKDNFDMLWFDIETNPSPGCGWSSTLADNCKFLSEMIDAGHKEGIKMGVYASEYMWGSIMGGDCKAGSDHGLPLWYADYDHKPSFDGFTGFGGWSKPDIKQYWDSVSIPCGISADADWKP
jgi:GH25 family lysozyme M1 (1,4-beta-N-acetylmuramidase)